MSQPSDDVREYVAIVRELASQPFDLYPGWPEACPFCSHTEPDPQEHKPSCLWRRAKALYTGEIVPL
jgi:hypothetical protein